MLRFIFLAFVCLNLTAKTDDRFQKFYYGKESYEAALAFQAKVQFQSDSKPSDTVIKDKIEKQLLHLFGPMSQTEALGAPKTNHRISEISSVVLLKDRTYSASYTYEGTVVVHDKAKDFYDLILPVNPDLIYEQAKVGDKAPCTDEHYSGEGDFWYFWHPSRKGCLLKKGEHFEVIRAPILAIPNTKVSYPEYSRLVQNREVPTIEMAAILGMDDSNHNPNPMTSDDINAQTYRSIREHLLKKGYQVSSPWSHGRFEIFVGHRVNRAHYAEEFVKQEKKARIVVRVFFGPTGVGEPTDGFYWLYKHTLENASVMVYDGHSGLGAHLDLTGMEQSQKFTIRPSLTQYQIYYFNSCTSYSYYNSQYFSRKHSLTDPKGTKNLDILTNGLGTGFEVLAEGNMALVDAIQNWAADKGTESYQSLALKIDSNNLFGINGDEDNESPTPKKN
mgnify:CR=1 FL=1